MPIYLSFEICTNKSSAPLGVIWFKILENKNFKYFSFFSKEVLIYLADQIKTWIKLDSKFRLLWELDSATVLYLLK